MYSMDNDIDHILVSEDALKAKVNELGAQISRDYAGKDLLLVSILKGSVVFMADLMRAVQIPCAIDFMVVSSYGGANTSSTGLVKIIKDLDADLVADSLNPAKARILLMTALTQTKDPQLIQQYFHTY